MILHTFIHVAPPVAELRRALSCPPEFFVDTLIEIALLDEEARQEKLRARLEKAAKRRDALRQQAEEKKAIDDLLEENRIRKIDELWDRMSKGVLLKFRIGTCKMAAGVGTLLLTRWGILVRKAVDKDDNERLQEVIALVGEARVKTAMPKQRLTLDKSIFREVMFALCGSDSALLSLKKIGAVRERGDNLELWAADAALTDTLMQKILDTAQRASLVKQARAFHVYIQGEVPIVFAYPWLSNLTLKSLQEIISDSLRLSPKNYTLLHFDKKLNGGKRSLKAQGIVPGSFVRLVRE